jgi:AraC-like DNA-binding protein
VSNFLPILLLLGAAQAGFLVFALLFAPNGNARANRYLAAYLALFAIALLDWLFELTGVTAAYPRWQILFWPDEYLYGALLYSYCREMTRPGTEQSHLALLLVWGLPFLHVCLIWPTLWLHEDLRAGFIGDGADLPPFFFAWRELVRETQEPLMLVQLTACLIASLSLLHQHSRRIQDIHSSIEQIRLRWLRNLLVFTAVLFVVQVIQAFVLDPLDINAPFIDPILGVSVVVLIYALGWMGLRQAAIFSDVGAPASGKQRGAVQTFMSGSVDSTAEELRAEKYARSALSEELAASLVDELQSLMQSKSLYLNQQLSLTDLAGELEVSTNYLSQAINDRLKINFFDYVNGYRVRHSLPLLATSQQTALEIAMDSGFNSKSAFYAAFRKHMGTTPGGYRKQMATSKVA